MATPPLPGALPLWDGTKYARYPCYPGIFQLCIRSVTGHKATKGLQSCPAASVVGCTCLYSPTLAKLWHSASFHALPELPRMRNAHIWASAFWSQFHHAHGRHYCSHMHEPHISPCVVGSVYVILTTSNPPIAQSAIHSQP